MQKRVLALLGCVALVSVWANKSINLVSKTNEAKTLEHSKVESSRSTFSGSVLDVAANGGKKIVSNNIQAKVPEVVKQRLSAAQQLLKQEVELLDKSNLDWDSHEKSLRRYLSSFSKNQLMDLGKTAVSKSSTANEKEVSLYLLSLAGIKAREALVFVLTTPREAPAKNDLHGVDSQTSQKLNALESLDVLAGSHSVEIKSDLQKIYAMETNPTLKSYLQVSLLGIAQGKPGKLSRWIERIGMSDKGDL